MALNAMPVPKKVTSVHRTPSVCPNKAALCGSANQALFGLRKSTFNALEELFHSQDLAVRARSFCDRTGTVVNLDGTGTIAAFDGSARRNRNWLSCQNWPSAARAGMS